MTRRFTPPVTDLDGVIEPILVLSSKFAATEQESIPDYFWPAIGKWKIRGPITLILCHVSSNN
jgi:phenol 2-monooxygenase